MQCSSEESWRELVPPRCPKLPRGAQTEPDATHKWAILQRLRDLYVIGGYEYCPSLVAREYDVPRSCLRVNLSNGELTQQRDMTDGRFSFAICNIGQQIFIFGGCNPDTFTSLQSGEMFNMLSNTWVSLPSSTSPMNTHWIWRPRLLRTASSLFLEARVSKDRRQRPVLSWFGGSIPRDCTKDGELSP